MKVLVPIKRVPDYRLKIQVNSDGSDINKDGIKWIVNPFDEIAVEEALKLKEAGIVTEITVLSIGESNTKEQLIYAMAMGADKSILLKTSEYIDSLTASKLIAEYFKNNDFNFILMGKQSIDSDASQTPQMIAEILDIDNLSFISDLKIEGSSATVVREVDGGLETVKANLPAVISTDLRLNEPRYTSLPGIMKARKKPFDEIEAVTVLADLKSSISINNFKAPPARAAGKMLKSIDELVDCLKNEAKVL